MTVPSKKAGFASTTPMRLFVYGTLKRGFHNHHYCAHAVDIQPAWTWGRLYDLRAGYPALEVPKDCILVPGTADPVWDAWQAIQREWLLRQKAKGTDMTPYGDWDQVQGELVTLADARRDLPPIDRLEGFRPGAAHYHSLYDRVLVPVWTEDGVVRPVWTYDGHRIADRGPRCQSWTGAKI